MSEKNFTDVIVQGPRNPMLIRAFCRKCGRYQSLNLTGVVGRVKLSCTTCGTEERHDEVEFR